MLNIYVSGASVDIGRQLENEAREIYFDLSGLEETYGQGTATLVHLRPSDTAPYICTTRVYGQYLVWTVTNTDTAYSGSGKCELRWVVGETLAKSIIYTTTIAPSIAGAEEVPSPYQSWYESLLENINEYIIASDQIETNAENIAENTEGLTILTGRVDEMSTLYVTPEMYGAKGDGVTDDSDALNTAFASGKIVKLTKGKTYFVSETLMLTSDFSLDGNGATLLFDNTDDLTYHNFIYGNEIENVIFSNLKLDGGTQTNLKYIIGIFSSNNIVLKDIEVTGGNGYAIRINDSSNVTIINSYAHEIIGADTNPGGFIYGQSFENLKIINCSCKDLYDHAVYITGNSNNILVDSCNFDRCGVQTSTEGAAITIYGDASNVIISNCNITNSKTGITLSKYDSSANAPKRVLINACNIYNSTLNAIHIFGEANKVLNDVFVVGNLLNTAVQDGINIKYCNGLLINDNDIKNVGRDGVRIGYSEDITIKGNVIKNVTSYPIYSGDGASDTDISILNNVFDSSTATYCIYFKNVGLGSCIVDENHNLGSDDISRSYYPSITFTHESGFSSQSTMNNIHYANHMLVGSIGIRGFSTFGSLVKVGTFSKGARGSKTYFGLLYANTTGACAGHWRLTNNELFYYVQNNLGLSATSDLVANFAIPLK